ncbi:hypothetical protein MKW94_013720 [Papaver nudicaule]|uniref:Mitochondrial import inner membrane translocase subunit n=1 Tax=Papaver nudicaule TaxID=74823 RepID=A0AA41V1L2_PAPNU|nr:hypothetical protein [Papaver nudicaule]
MSRELVGTDRILQEKQRAMVNEMVAKLTNTCWDQCVTSILVTSLARVNLAAFYRFVHGRGTLRYACCV